MSEKTAIERIGGFRVLEALHGGSGAQGTVCRAVCEEATVPGIAVGDIVALKTMSVADEDGSHFRRLQRRTDVLAGIGHPNIVRYRGCFSVVDAFTSMHVVAMECLEGETLKDRLLDNPGGLDADEGLAIALKAVAGLEAAIAAGIVHRDIKPSNIFICRDGAVKLIDFELARNEGGTTSVSGGRFLGTFDYMAPEFTDASFRGDERSDVFSMGVVLHEALCGRTPYADGKSGGRQADFDFLARWSEGSDRMKSLSVSARAHRLLSGMKEVLTRALSPDRNVRFASFAEFRAALEAVRFRELRNGGSHYRLLKHVGKGGFGEVFKARMLPEGQLVAVKHLMKSAYGERFRREARIMQRFRDPCFTRFIDYFEVSRAGAAEAYLVMDFLSEMPGSSLRDAIKAAAPARLVPSEVIAAFVRYAHGLAVLHAGNVYHRDIKPSNLYYPKGRSGDAVIMDMGIARDAGGSVTAGDVPGTLDYMPPEIVTSGSRGDSRMDIYALGLCFYEALTGRQGYARLPSGSDGLREFYTRSRQMRPPEFDDAEILRRPAVLDLLRRMTDPDFKRRIADAAEVERLLRGLDWNSVSLAPVRRSSTLPVQPARPVRPSARPPVQSVEPETRDTSPTGVQDADFAGNPLVLRWTVRLLTAALLLGGVVFAVFLARKSIMGCIERVQEWQIARQEAEERTVAERKAAAEAAAADQAERAANAKAATAAAESVRAVYDRSLYVTEGDEALARWKLDWSRRKLPEGWLDERLRELLVAQENCRGRMQDRRQIADYEADAVESEYLNARSLEQGDALARAWIGKWATNGVPEDAFGKRTNAFVRIRNASAERIRVRAEGEVRSEERRKAVGERTRLAQEDAKALIAKYADPALRKSKVDSEYAEWGRKWGDLASTVAFKSMNAEIRAAQEEKGKSEHERAVVDECRALFDNVWTTTADNVRNWRDYLDRATIEVKKAFRTGRLSAKGRDGLEREIADMRKWAVGVIDNKTHETLSFMGRKVKPIDETLFVLTNGVPEYAAITCEGYEPIRVTATRFDARTFVVMNSDLVRSVGTSQIEVPKLPGGILCFVDGMLCGSGTVKVSPGKHECIYRNEQSSVGGVRDFLDQKNVVQVSESSRVALEPPGEWVESPECKSARENAANAKKGDEIEKAILKGMETLPLETRRQRLEKVFSILKDWRTPALLGKRRLADLNARYEAERKRVVGLVVNGLESPLRVKVYDHWTAIQPGANAMISYADGMPVDAKVAVQGYEYLFLPKADGFDGKEFVVEERLLVPTPVMVTVPELGDGVECRIAGSVTKGTVELKPGQYVCVYSRSGFADQRSVIEVMVGKDMTLADPGKWEPVGAFGRLVDAVKDASDSTARGLKSATQTIGTIERKNGRTE